MGSFPGIHPWAIGGGMLQHPWHMFWNFQIIVRSMGINSTTSTTIYKANKNSDFQLSQGFSQGAVQLGDCGMESSPSWLSGGKYISLNTLASFRNSFPIPATSRARLLACRDCSDEPGLRYDMCSMVQKYVKQVMLQQEHKNQGACHYHWHHRDGGPCLPYLQWDVEREVAPAKWTLIPWN